MAEEKHDDVSPDAMPVKVNFRILGRMPSVYAHHMSIQPGESEVVLSFFEVIPPPIFPPDETALKQLSEAGVVAECVARVTIANNRFSNFVKAFQQYMVDDRPNEEAKNNADTSRDNK
jgi:hypothetical protein